MYPLDGCDSMRVAVGFVQFRCTAGFFQAKQKELVLMRMPQGCGALPGRVVRLNRSVYGLNQASRSWHSHLVIRLKSLGFEQNLTDACVFRLIDSGSVSINAVVHVDDIFTVARKERCDRFLRGLEPSSSHQQPR